MNMNSNPNQSSAAILRAETNLMPLFLDILEAAQKNQGSAEINNRFVTFKSKVKQCRLAIEKIKGLEINMAGQMADLDHIQNQLNEKSALLDKYSSLKAAPAVKQ